MVRNLKCLLQGEQVGVVDWELVGDHNVDNALMAIAAARHVGVAPELACEALGRFINTKRRLELKGEESMASRFMMILLIIQRRLN